MNLDYFLFEKLYLLFPHGPFFDWVFLIFSALGHTRLIWPALVIGFLLFHHQKKGWILLEAALAMGIGVIVNELVLKNFFARPRPFELFSNLPNLDIMTTGFSFPSSHAIAVFSLTTVLILNIKNKWIKFLFLGYALLVCYSRIYLGVHFPLDLLVGAFIGILFGFLVSRYLPLFYRPLYNKFK